MTVKAVTFDCAQTLVAVDWRPATVAVESAVKAGVNLEQSLSAERFDRMLRERWPRFVELNLTRDSSKTDEFWHRLTIDWAKQCSIPDSKVEELLDITENTIFGSESKVFSLYGDVITCLDTLKAAGLRLAVISNWDISLHKTLRAFGLYDYFEVVIASMEEGVEKPDPRIFQIAFDRLGLTPEEVVHVGDNPQDDLMGAKAVGMAAYVIDRSNGYSSSVHLSTLTDLPARLGL